MLALLMQIATAALSVLSVYVGSGAASKIDIAAELVKIAKAANAAHVAHTGEPINPNLIKPIEPIP